MKIWILTSILILGALTSQSQINPGSTGLSKHFIYFKDKTNTPFSIQEPKTFLSTAALDRRQRYQIPVVSRDLPVTPEYVAQLKANGARVWYTSRWFNGALVQCDTSTYRKIKALPFVKETQTVGLRASKNPSTNGQNYITLKNQNDQKLSFVKIQQEFGESYGQAKLIGVPAMHADGYRGEGISIAVFDGGFSGVNRIAAFNHLFRDKKIKATFDFVDKNANVFKKDNHGTEVLSTLAANQPGTFVGTAPQAVYSLFITEDVKREQKIEEINWLLAAEFADSAGVDIIQTSLGYNTFDGSSGNYSYQDMNGDKAICTRAADFAAATGMLVVVSAGNEGNNGWQYITAPADADSVLSIGATDSLGNRAIFSSLGPASDGRIKPELAGQGLKSAVIDSTGKIIGANGTSFSSPIICGLVAGFWQANRQLTNLQVMDYLKLSGSQATQPDNRLGFGIPHFKRAQLLAQQDSEKNLTGFKLFPNPVKDNHFTVLVPVNADQNTEIKIFNAIGQEVNVFTYHYDKIKTDRTFVTFEITGLSAGMYQCVITSLNRSETIRFLKL
ncbi:S8 family serine peptidase [Adhaeribacter radiodurans]|uniref:S8 family serine peptidase n=1 Tax=Adhaeribacter radiodurans TaxID=2745197 RepID=A0A7L7L6J8_9BACT|nr:S8 family serine peptidase [Adhaeribacter radiodurans]QMU28430.1 S8 family serine peptidase [Adhaeribacter radiodurans]